MNKVLGMKVFLVILLFFYLQNIFAQQYNFKNFSVNEGIGQSQVYAMCEDTMGNIWLGTRGGGLSKFDGINFTNYTVQEGLPTNSIRAITKDFLGNLWIGTDNGLCKFDGRKFVNYGHRQGLYHLIINTVFVDKDSVLWIGTNKGIFQMQQDTIVRFGRKINAPLEEITSIIQDKSGDIYAGTNFGLFHFFRSNKNWNMNAFNKSNGLNSNFITSLALKQEEIWIGTYGGGIGIFKNGKFSQITNKNGLSSNIIFNTWHESDTVSWIATSEGVNKIVNHRDTIFSIQKITQAEGLASNAVRCVLKDSFGNMWFGTSGAGVSKLDSERFRHHTAKPGIFGNLVYDIYQDHSGLIWFATSDGGVTTFDGKNYKKYDEGNGFTNCKIKCINQDKKGRILFGSIGNGLFILNKHKFFNITTTDGLGSNYINAIQIDTEENIFLATAGGGISYSMNSPGEKIFFKNITIKDGLGTNRVHDIYLKNDGTLFSAGTHGSIDSISYQKNGNFKVTSLLKEKNNNGNIVRSIASGANGVMYFGTSNEGIYWYANGIFKQFSKTNGLQSNNIYSLIFDKDNNLYIGSEKGIDKCDFYPDHPNYPFMPRVISHFGKSEGFIGIETVQNSNLLDTAGHIWFGTLNTATVYYPERELPFKFPKVSISGIKLFFDKIENTKFGKSLLKGYSNSHNISLPYNQNHLSFEFIGVEQRNPEAVRYHWMLEGFDKNWSPISDKQEAVYSNLPAGNYTFKVNAKNELNQWAAHPVKFKFEIRQAFWNTWWLKFIILIVLGIFLWLMIFYYKRKIKKENKIEKERLEAEKSLLELEQKALRLQMNPHFLFNCLNSIKGLIANNEPEKAKVYLSKFAKMMRAMLEQSTMPFISLSQEIEGLYIYVNLEKLSSKNTFDFNIDVSDLIDLSQLTIPPMLIQPFVENAIIHGIIMKEECGSISVKIFKENEILKCLIEDNGIGRKKSQELKSKHSQHHSSAIIITQERLAILNRKQGKDCATIKIEDITDLLGLVTGTRVTLTLPLN